MSWDFLLTSLIVVVSPGTGVLFTLAAGLSRGPRASVIAAFGCTLGIIPHIPAAVHKPRRASSAWPDDRAERGIHAPHVHRFPRIRAFRRSGSKAHHIAPERFDLDAPYVCRGFCAARAQTRVRRARVRPI